MRCGKEEGFGLVEVMIALAVLAIGIVGLLGSILPAIRLSDTSRETMVAMNAARKMIETLDRNWDFDKTFIMYNEDPADDPGGAGTAPGPHFLVEELLIRADDADGCAGRIAFPVSAGGELIENLADAEPGLARDINGSGTIEGGNRSLDYILLPVTVFIEWQGVSGARSIEVHTLLAER